IRLFYFFFQAEDGIRDRNVTGVQTCALPISLFMGLQSSLFYILISWLPEIMIDDGLNPTNAGFVLALFQLVAIPVSFTIPMFAIRYIRQSMIVLFVNILFIIGMIGLILQTNWTITLISV